MRSGSAESACQSAARRDAVAPWVLRAPARGDGPAIRELVAQCAPLDLNSVYAYLLLAEHFSSSCVVVVRDDWLAGFVSAYVPPARPDVLFVWQVAVHRRARGRHLGARMIHELLARDRLAGVRCIETTVGPSNRASRRLFSRVAEDLRAAIAETPLFTESLLGAGHEAEPLLRIGPFHAHGVRGMHDDTHKREEQDNGLENI